MSEEQKIPEEELPDPGYQLAEEKSENQKSNSEEANGDTAKEPIQPSTSSLISKSSEMEVHHHTHPGHQKKKWTDYFWEFLMLFLAVFCGFLAEYQLEHTIEKQKEDDYIQSMIEDLQNDTTKLNKVSRSLTEIKKSIDTILLYYNDIAKSNPILLRNIKAINSYPIFIYSDRTIQQLKYSGGMRLIKNKKAAEGIMDYDAIVRNYENNGAYVQRFWEGLTAQRLNIIDGQSLENDFSGIGEIENEKSYLITNDQIILKKFKNFIYELQIYHGHTINANVKLEEKASRLIEILKKEYHMK